MLNTSNVELSVKYLKGKSLSSSQSEHFKEKDKDRNNFLVF